MELKSEYNIIEKLGKLSGEGVLTYHLDSQKFVYFNEYFLKLVDVTEAELKKNPLVLLQKIVPEDLQYVQNRYAEFIRDGQVSNSEFRIKSRDKLTNVSCDAVLIKEESVIMILIKDISAQYVHQDFAVNYGAQKDTMLDMLTHNLSGPLLMSREIIDNIKDPRNPENIEALNKMLSLIRENTQQCIDIVNDFLKEEHHDSIRTIVKSIRFDVVEKINVTLEKLKALNKDKTFLIKSTSQKLVITADAVKFFQVIHNIVSNAIKFTAPDGRIEVDVTEQADTVTICISDNGIGIPEQIKSGIFKGTVISRAGLNGEKSSGLGLSIASQLVARMRGEIWFESEENKGSSFYVRLPKEFGAL